MLPLPLLQLLLRPLFLLFLLLLPDHTPSPLRRRPPMVPFRDRALATHNSCNLLSTALFAVSLFNCTIILTWSRRRLCSVRASL